MSPYEIPWEDAYCEKQREDYDSGASWCLLPYEDEEEEEEDDEDEYDDIDRQTGA